MEQLILVVIIGFVYVVLVGVSNVKRYIEKRRADRVAEERKAAEAARLAKARIVVRIGGHTFAM